MGSYLEHSFNASDFMEENAPYMNASGAYENFGEIQIPFPPQSTSQASGNYVYRHSALLGGVSKSFGEPDFLVTFKLLFGYIVFNTPEIKGTINATGDDTISHQWINVPLNCTIQAGHQSLFTTDIGICLKKSIIHRIYFLINADFIFAGTAGFNMNSQLTGSGGTIIGNSTLSTSTGVSMFNLTAGVGYAFY